MQTPVEMTASSHSSTNELHIKRKRRRAEEKEEETGTKKRREEEHREDEGVDVRGCYGDIPQTYRNQPTLTFGGRTSRTSSRSSSQKTISSVGCGKTSSSRTKELHEALARLLYAKKLKFADLQRAKQYVSQSEAHLHIFMMGSDDQRLEMLNEELLKGKVDTQETKIPDSS